MAIIQVFRLSQALLLGLDPVRMPPAANPRVADTAAGACVIV